MVRVDEEFRTLIPPLTDDEFQRLERSILDEGVREPIITWNGVIVDGHNRYNITQKHALVCPTRERQFESRDAAKLFIISNQLSRRNLPVAAIGDLKLEEKEIVAKQAEARMLAGKADPTPNLGETKKKDKHDGETFTQLAKDIPLGRESLRKLDRIKREAKEGNPVAISEREKLLSGEKKSIHSAYIEVVGRPKPRKPSEIVADDGRKICHMCGEPINPEDAHAVRPNVHKTCELEYQRDWVRDHRGGSARDRDADKDLRENVATYTRESLFTELAASAKSLHESWDESIEINESMGVQLTAKEKKALATAAANLLETIQHIKEGA